MASFRRWQKLNAKRIAKATSEASVAGNARRASACGVMRFVFGIKKALLPFGSRAFESDRWLLSRALLRAYPNGQVSAATQDDGLFGSGRNNDAGQRRTSAVP